MAARYKALFGIGIAAGLVLATSSAGYYSELYRPLREATLDQGRLVAETQAYAAKRAAQLRAAAEERKRAERAAEAAQAASGRYRDCVANATAARAESWADACRRIAEKAAADLVACQAKANMPRGYCAAVYRTRDASPTCALPTALASDLDGGLTAARSHCLHEREASLR